MPQFWQIAAGRPLKTYNFRLPFPASRQRTDRAWDKKWRFRGMRGVEGRTISGPRRPRCAAWASSAEPLKVRTPPKTPLFVPKQCNPLSAGKSHAESANRNFYFAPTLSAMNAFAASSSASSRRASAGSLSPVRRAWRSHAAVKSQSAISGFFESSGPWR